MEDNLNGMEQSQNNCRNKQLNKLISQANFLSGIIEENRKKLEQEISECLERGSGIKSAISTENDPWKFKSFEYSTQEKLVVAREMLDEVLAKIRAISPQ